MNIYYSLIGIIVTLIVITFVGFIGLIGAFLESRRRKNNKLRKFISLLKYETIIQPYGTDDNSISNFIWLLDIPEEQLCDVQDDAIELAFKLYEDEPVPFIIGVASPVKSNLLRKIN